MRQVLAWAMQHDPAIALRLAVALAPWWLLRGRLAGQYPHRGCGPCRPRPCRGGRRSRLPSSARPVAASLAGGKGIEAAELAIRAGLTSLGRGMLEDLLTADAGYRGPRIGCGTGHQAEFVSCRPKTVDTVLGPVTVNRAWYHCAACGHGLGPAGC